MQNLNHPSGHENLPPFSLFPLSWHHGVRERGRDSLRPKSASCETRVDGNTIESGSAASAWTRPFQEREPIVDIRRLLYFRRVHNWLVSDHVFPFRYKGCGVRCYSTGETDSGMPCSPRHGRRRDTVGDGSSEYQKDQKGSSFAWFSNVAWRNSCCLRPFPTSTVATSIPRRSCTNSSGAVRSEVAAKWARPRP